MAAMRPEPTPPAHVTARVVLTTAPDSAVAEQLARGLLEHRHAACVQLLPGVQSLYHWEGEVASEGEVLLFAKTVDAKVAGIEAFLQEHHPYDVPEMVVLRAEHVAQAYGAWLARETATPPA